MTHLFAHLLAHHDTSVGTSFDSFGLAFDSSKHIIAKFCWGNGDNELELDLPSDGDDAVQLEQSEDDKQINCEICGNNKKAKKQLHCYSCINDIKCVEIDAKAKGKEAFLCFRKTKKI